MLHLPFVGRLPTSFAARQIAVFTLLTAVLAGGLVPPCQCFFFFF